MMNDEQTQNLDSIIDGLDLQESVEDTPEVEETENVVEESEQAEEEEVSPAKAYEDAIAKFEQTGNPHDLPEPLRRQELARQADYTRKMQELARIRKAHDEPEKPQEVKAPTIDLEAEPEVLTKQIGDVIRYEVEKQTAAARLAAEQLSAFQQNQGEIERIRGLEDHVRSLDGFDANVEKAMAEKLRQHVDDPEWKTLMGTKVGLSMLFDQVKRELGTSKSQDGAAQRAEAKLRSPATAKTRKADSLSTEERYKGLSPYDKLAKAVDEGVGNVSYGE